MELTEAALSRRASTADALRFAWDAGVFRADHVMSALGLTRSTTLSALDTLVSLGLVREVPCPEKPSYRMGRPPRHFELRGEAGVVAGIDAGDRQFSVVAADLSGTILAREHVAVPGFENPVESDPRLRCDAALTALDNALAAAGRSRADVVSVVVGVPAPVGVDGCSPAHDSGFWQYMNAGLREALAQALPSVRVENDASLAAIAESRLGSMTRQDHFVAMVSGRRLGSGVFLDGRLVRGANGGVGELETLSHVAGVGGTDGFGPLTTRWVRRAREEGIIAPTHPWASDLSTEAIMSTARPEDPAARALLHDLGSTLGRVCAVISRFYDPTHIVVCGAMAQSLHEVIAIAQRHVDAESEFALPHDRRLDAGPRCRLPRRDGGRPRDRAATISPARQGPRPMRHPLLG